jgi:hypothetical protein
MTCTEITFRVIELVIAASIPILITIFGFKLSGKVEDIKNESASKYLWRTKWTDVLFQKHLVYCDNMVEFIANFTRLFHLLEMGKAESEEGKQLQEINNTVIVKVYRTSVDLRLHSINVLGQNNEIERLLNEIWEQMKYILNNKRMDERANLDIMFSKLRELNQVTGKLVENKRVH